jgi:diphthine-ammonia ligase
MKVGVLFSGGKDSCLASLIAREEGYEIGCLITIVSENKESFMFHTPSVERAVRQAEVMGIPIIVRRSRGEKENELVDLEEAIKETIEKYEIDGIVSGAVESVYQASRIQRICNKLDIECFNPLWQKEQVELLEELLKRKFKAIIVGVFAYPLGEGYLGREIDEKFISDIKKMRDKWGINPAGEGGEFETFVLDCPMFSSELRVKSYKDFGEGNSWRREIILG